MNCAFFIFLAMQLLLLRCEYVGNSARVFHIFTSVRLDFQMSIQPIFVDNGQLLNNQGPIMHRHAPLSHNVAR